LLIQWGSPATIPAAQPRDQNRENADGGAPIGPGSTPILGPMNQARTLAREAFTHFAKKDFGDAIRLYREAIEHDASLGLAWNGLSMALAQSGDLAAAIEAAEKLVEIEPDDPLSHTNLSRLYQQDGRIEDAERVSAAAIQRQMRGSK